MIYILNNDKNKSQVLYIVYAIVRLAALPFPVLALFRPFYFIYLFLFSPSFSAGPSLMKSPASESLSDLLSHSIAFFRALRRQSAQVGILIPRNANRPGWKFPSRDAASRGIPVTLGPYLAAAISRDSSRGMCVHVPLEKGSFLPGSLSAFMLWVEVRIYPQTATLIRALSILSLFKSLFRGTWVFYPFVWMDRSGWNRSFSCRSDQMIG